MKIHRTSSRNFAKVPNVSIRDDRLSWKARGLLAYILSHTDTWTLDADRLVTHGPDGRASILAGLHELVTAGYITRTKRRGEKGQWVTDIEIWDTPQTGTQATAPTSGFPTSGNRLPEPPAQTRKTPVRAGSRFSDVGTPPGGKPDAVVIEDQQEDQEEDSNLGGTLPPNPLSPEPPPGTQTEQPNPPPDQPTPHQPPDRNSPPENPPKAIGRAQVPTNNKCQHKLSGTQRTDGYPTCTLCRREATHSPTAQYATVIPINRGA